MYSYRQVTEEPRLIWEEYNLELNYDIKIKKIKYNYNVGDKVLCVNDKNTYFQVIKENIMKYHGQIMKNALR